MNSIVFVQRELEDKLGPMVLTAHLKSFGYSASILIDPQNELETLKKLNPTFIGLSVLTPSVLWAITTAQRLKRVLPQTRVILGGPHPTFFPEIVEADGVDIVCIGEGEKPLQQILASYDGTLGSVARVPNCWVKDGATIHKNPLTPLLTEEELTALPSSDRTHYAMYPELRHNPHKKIWTSRGCPYKCSFCFNYQYNQLYQGLGKIVRRRTVDSVIHELQELKRYGWKCMEVVDDQFLLSKEWLADFCEKYRKYIQLPFACNTTANQITPEAIAMLKQAGCKTVCFGVESGVESIRNKVYHKPISDQDLIRAADILHSHHMPFLTFNMIGLPDESLEDIYKTIELNRKMRTTFPWCSIVQPYPGTAIAEYIKEHGVQVKSQFTYSYFDASIIADPVKARMFSNAQKLFAHLVKSNVGFDRFCSLVQKAPLHLDALYAGVFYWHYGNNIRRRYGLSWPALFRYWLYSRQN